MKPIILFYTIIFNFLLTFIQSKSIDSENKPRIFFAQLAESTGFFPIEINVPDTISSMMSGLSSMYEAASSFFGSGNESESQGEESVQEIIHDEQNINTGNSKVLLSKKKKRKLTRGSKKIMEKNDYDYLFNYLLF
ncbi:hypothetical protein PVAND_010975 [Polypedilum vanderplanki]|uniref:Uncharacterized protein n=1 Tax=Polypedilum vanderplanki TaxID=319348 RepID=A0A9J6CIJ9_POLVA|nr:hypothetical protein PVAND_010975 [Polypedilum vanderplanki]